MRRAVLFTWVIVLVGSLAGVAHANGTIEPTPSPVPSAAGDAFMEDPFAPVTPTSVPPADVAVPAGDPRTSSPAGDAFAPDIAAPGAVGRSSWPTEPTDVAVDQAITAMVCVDTNANRWCDGNEGLGGMPIVFQDADTGRVLALVVSDQTGSAQRTLRVRANQGVTVAAPYLGTLYTVRGTGQLDQFIVDDIPALPGLLP